MLFVTPSPPVFMGQQTAEMLFTTPGLFAIMGNQMAKMLFYAPCHVLGIRHNAS